MESLTSVTISGARARLWWWSSHWTRMQALKRGQHFQTPTHCINYEKAILKTATEVSNYKALLDLYTFESFVRQELKCRAATEIDVGCSKI